MMILPRAALKNFCASGSHPVVNLTHGFSKHAGASLLGTEGLSVDLSLNHS